ncbi:MAG: ANTAR domain-containing protein [Clostridiaceae bacterium]|jgi:AmiR/NasT family two-component response regulator|nr:ANTAR domain-containing protein [Clostridiaceae bacterium]
MDRALVISCSGKSAVCLANILTEASVTDITTISNAGEARRVLIEKDFDLCVINTPLPDEFGEGLARNIAAQKVCVVILIVKSELFEKVSSKVEKDGVITIPKPISKPLFYNALKLTSVMHRRINAIKNENRMLIQKIEDIRIIDRAKCILISHLSLSEPEAHRYIEKQAMDMRQTRRKVAEEILKTYEN